MKTGFLPWRWAPGLFIAVSLIWISCQKQQTSTQNTPTPCSDFNKRINQEKDYDETEANDLAQYSSAGGLATFTWKISVSDACENGPLDLTAKMTVAEDTSVKVKIGYSFLQQQTEKVLSCQRSAEYKATINSQPANVIDIYNEESSVNYCTSCKGVRPAALDFYIQASFPSTGYLDKDREKLRSMLKGVNLKLGYIRYQK